MIPSTPVVRYDKLQPDEVKEVLLCLLYVLKHADEEALMAWWHNASQHDLICFFHILEYLLRPTIINVSNNVIKPLIDCACDNSSIWEENV